MLKVPLFNSESEFIYRLIDPYSSFYLKWVEPARQSKLENIDADYWLKIVGTPQWYSWAGRSFESICLKHIQAIKKSLGISGVLTQTSTWQCKADIEIDSKGAQIDVVIDRADQCINLGELKFIDK